MYTHTHIYIYIEYVEYSKHLETRRFQISRKLPDSFFMPQKIKPPWVARPGEVMKAEMYSAMAFSCANVALGLASEMAREMLGLLGRWPGVVMEGIKG